MSWNNRYERKKFEAKQKKQAEEYRKLGMTEEQIKEMYEFDLAQFNSNRRYHMHTQPIQVEEFDKNACEESDNSLIKYFSEELTSTIDDLSEHSRYWWIEEIEDSIMAQRLKLLSDEDIELLTKRVMDGFSQAELAKVYGISQKNICKKLNRIKKFLLQGV